MAAHFVACIEAGDIEGVRACFGPDATVWHNNDGLTVPATKVLRILAWLARNVTGLRYDVTRRAATADGYVQQHVLRGTAADGSELAVAACLIVRLEEGSHHPPRRVPRHRRRGRIAGLTTPGHAGLFGRSCIRRSVSDSLRS